MFGPTWETSPREHGVTVERDVAIPVDDGVDLVGDVFRPDADGEFPVILSASCYNTEFQTAPIEPRRGGPQNAWMEAGDPHFFARRGYAHAIVNVRGTGKSGGEFRNLGPREAEDVAEAVEWLAERPWSSGRVGTFGISYFGMIQLPVAELAPEPLEAIFAPWAASDLYRDWYYHGGILHHAFTYKWTQQIDNPRCRGWTRERLADDEFDARVAEALRDEEIRAHDVLVEALRHPDEGVNPILVDAVLNRFDEPGGYFDERSASFERTDVPAYFGADWGHYNLHLPAAFGNFVAWDGPAKLLVGPPEFVDRPFYQLQYESLRWFDHWLKDNDTGLMDEPDVRLFLMDTGRWTTADEWPLPETRWTPFYLHPDGLLYERDHLPGDGYDTFSDSPFGRGSLEYATPALVERTELVGPVVADLYASTTAEELLLFVTLLKRAADGEETTLSAGWLRGSQRAEDTDRSEPWWVHHPHEAREPIEPGAVERYRLNVMPVGAAFEPGSRVVVRIACADVPEGGEVDIPHPGIRAAFAEGRHLSRQSASRVTVYHDAERPSAVHLPVTAGNVMGTYRSGGGPRRLAERLPYRKVWADEREPAEGGGD